MSKKLMLMSSNITFSNIIKRINIGSFILGDNNYINMQSKYSKEIYSQIEGILLNTKCHIKDQLTTYSLRTLSAYELINNKKFMITA